MPHTRYMSKRVFVKDIQPDTAVYMGGTTYIIDRVRVGAPGEGCVVEYHTPTDSTRFSFHTRALSTMEVI